MDSSTQTMADDAKSMNDLFQLVEKLTIQLNEKDKELATKEQHNKDLSANMDSAMARANEAQEQYKTMNVALQMSLWKSFPSSHLHYYIKTKAQLGWLNGNPPLIVYNYLYADSSGKLRSSGNQPIPCAAYFKCTRNSDGSFAIYSMSKEKYLQIDTSDPKSSTKVMFSASNCSINTKFVLSFYQQNLLPGLLVDIRPLATDDCFLYMNGNQVMAYSSYSEQNKFLILPVDGQ